MERAAGTVAAGAPAVRAKFTPVYSFPILDNSCTMLGTDWRVCRQARFTVNVDRLGRVLR